MHQPERAGALFDVLFACPELVSPERRYRLQQQRGHTLMALDRYAEALVCYSECTQYAIEHGEPPAIMLVYGFNSAESQRRASRKIAVSAWKQVTELFGHAGASSDEPSPNQANQWQSMHIAFACCGDFPAACDALRKARRAAESVGEVEDVFSVKAYRMVPVTEFLAINDEMLAALERGELWDGMKLPTRTD